MKKEHTSVKLRKLKEIRRKDLERNFLDVQLKGQDHYVFIKENGKAQVVYQEGRWVKEHISTAVLKFNYEVDKTNNMLIREFEDKYIQQYEKTLE
tara:strand:+ start:195 stop:479 length:285 start_codon:yes stop_codon:yes gene_type:complete